MKQSGNALFDSFGLLPAQFPQELQRRLADRIAQDPEYSHEEVERVAAISSRICGKDFELSLPEYERLRVLCILSQCALADVNSISSHRKFLGPLIVRAKRIFWRIISSQLRSTFMGIQEFSAWMLVSHIKTLEKLHSLEQRIARDS